jgi:hypothetical protein
MRHAVHERNRDLLPVLAQVRLRLGDVAFLPGHAEVISHLADDLPCVIAQVAP